MPLGALAGSRPRLGERVWLAPTAWVIGDVEVGDDASFWFHTVVRGDVNWIRIGAATNVQDGALVGIGARVLDGAVVGSGAQVGAGAVVAPGERIAAGHLALGVPARVVRPLSAEEAGRIAAIRDRYVALKDRYRSRLAVGEEG